MSGWGLTEAPILTMASVHDPDDKLATTEGRPMPGVLLRAVTLDGTVAGPGEEGELRAKAPQMMRGYLDAALDEAAFDEDGWFRTGDLGVIDEDGYVRITGRLKDVIIRKGENVSAQEVEDLLYEHEQVADVAVIGLPDDERGEMVCAVVVRAPRVASRSRSPTCSSTSRAAACACRPSPSGSRSSTSCPATPRASSRSTSCEPATADRIQFGSFRAASAYLNDPNSGLGRGSVGGGQRRGLAGLHPPERGVEAAVRRPAPRGCRPR